MFRNKINNNNNLIIKKNLIKTFFKKLIIKSIIQSKDINAISRAYAQYKQSLLFKNKKYNISSIKNVCFQSGKYKSTTKKLQISRYTLKQFCLLNKIQNVKQNT